MTTSVISEDSQFVRDHLNTKIEAVQQSSGEDKAALIIEIKQLLKQEDAVMVAHYYTEPELQALAEETGGCVADSLEMARFGRDHPATTLVVIGVKFMGGNGKNTQS